MFKLVPAPTFPVKVNITVPGQEAPAVLNLVCRHKTREACKAWIASPTSETSNAQFLSEIVEGWDENVQGADGAPLAFTPEHFAALLDNFPASTTEVLSAYMTALHESRAKKLAKVATVFVEGPEDFDEVNRAVAAFIEAGFVPDTPWEPYAAADQALGVWPENWTPVCVFADLNTQWQHGMNGVVGLRYEALQFVMRLHRVEPEHEREVFGAVRVIECEVLRLLSKRK